MHFSKISIFIFLTSIFAYGLCYESIDNQEKIDIYQRIFSKKSNMDEDIPKYRFKKNSQQKYLIMRTSGLQNFSEDQNINGNAVKKMSKQNLVELNRLLSMLKKNRNPSKDDLEKYRNLQRIIFSYGRK